jgi:tetratricopeptide (TPR) repeat protein
MFDQEILDNPEMLKEISEISEKIAENFPDEKSSFKDFISGMWTRKKLKVMSTSAIIEKLESMGVDFKEERFKEQAQNYVSAIQLAEDHYYTQNFHAGGSDEDFIWLAIIELWDRITPEKFSVEKIDDLMQEGYKDIEKRSYKSGMEKWEKTWVMIKSLVPANLHSVEEADEFFSELTQFISNWCQDFEMELHNAGLEDSSFFAKRIKYCRDFCRIFPLSDELILQNMLIAEAESYAAIGDIATADKKFQDLIKRFPNNAWGYITWGDMYCESKLDSDAPVNYEKAEKIYRLGLANCNTEIDAVNERLEYLENNRKGSKSSKT